MQWRISGLENRAIFWGEDSIPLPSAIFVLGSLSNSDTLLFLESWKELHHPDFKVMERNNFRFMVALIIEEARNLLDTVPGQEQERNRLKKGEKD